MGIEAKTHWNPAHYAAIQIELEEYKDKLTFVSEHPLTQEPLEIDVIVIKKEKNVEIKKNIGSIFRGYNIVEVKSETDYVSISDFYKVHGYGMLYISLEKIHPLDITLTFITRRHPTKLFKLLQDEIGCEIKEVYNGIYYIQGCDKKRLVLAKTVSATCNSSLPQTLGSSHPKRLVKQFTCSVA